MLIFSKINTHFINHEFKNVMQWNVLKHPDSWKISMEIVTEIFYNLRRKMEWSNILKKWYANTYTNHRQRKKNHWKEYYLCTIPTDLCLFLIICKETVKPLDLKLDLLHQSCFKSWLRHPFSLPRHCTLVS